METKVADILKEKERQIVSVTPDTTVLEAIRIMVEKDIGAMLVMEGEQLQGIFTERDYMKKIIVKGLSSKDTPVKAVMTEKIAVISPEATLEEGLAAMAEKNCRHLPIFQDKKLLGLISIGDLAKRMINDQKITINNLAEYIAGHWDQ